MKRFFIRCMGVILSTFSAFLTIDRAESSPYFDYAKTYTFGNDKYRITIYTGAAWYVGWKNMNAGGSTTYNSEYTNLFSPPYGACYDQPAVLDYNAITGSSTAYTGLFISSRSFCVPEKTYIIPTTGVRFVDPIGIQNFLQDSAASWVVDLGPLVYLRSASGFGAAGCCYYTPPEQSPGSYAFSYSGDGRSVSECPCFYTTADKVYTGSTCANYDGKGTEYCTGTSVIGIGDGTSKNWPAMVRDVFFCYTYSGCVDDSPTYSTFNNDTYAGYSGCHMIRVPIVGLDGATYNDLMDNVDTVSSTDGTTTFSVFNPELTRGMKCGGGLDKYMSCASGAVKTRYLYSNQYGNVEGCFPCPDVAGSTVGGYTLSNTSYDVDNNVVGIGACQFTKPVSSDGAGIFELTYSDGTSQTCYAS